MKLALVAVGHRMPAWIVAGFEDYARRMPRDMPLGLIEVRPERRSGDSAAAVRKIVEAEARRVVAALPARCRRVVLDERGTQWTTMELARRLEAWRMEGGDVAFVVGGADGLDASVKKGAQESWSLSRLTLPHALVRVLVAEQLYRAATILQGHPYHRA
jgi:23S rRNA (pseudouridine1915-N3)-methyltransferase